MRTIFIIELWAIMNSILNELCLTLTDIKKKLSGPSTVEFKAI